MGRTVTSTYRIEVAANIPGFSPFGWNCKIHGKPSDTTAEVYRSTMNKSFQPGGVNWGVSEANGIVPHLSEVRIVRQETGEVVASAKAPRFEVV